MFENLNSQLPDTDDDKVLITNSLRHISRYIGLVVVQSTADQEVHGSNLH